MEIKMSQFKTELHCHTQESSVKCGKIPAADIVDAYINAGYSTLVITDHYGAKHRTENGIKYDIDKFLEGFYSATNAAQGRINIILGMEINLSENHNDYLIYGMTKDFIKINPEMYNMEIKELSNHIHENGLLIYQAHPFRNYMSIIPPSYLDGIEAFNAHPRHDSRNSIAKAWAELYNLNTISGSDAHRIPDLCQSGIITEKEIKTSSDLLDILKNNEYQLITF